MSEWHNYGRWIQAPLSGAFWAHWHESESLKKVIEHPFTPFLFIHGHTIEYKQDQAYVRTWLEDVLKHDAADETRKVFETEAAKAVERHRELLSSNLGDIDYAKRLFETYRDLVGIWSFAIFIDEALTAYLQEKSGETTESLLEKTRVLPKRKTWLEQETIDLKIIAKASRTGMPTQNVEELLKKHVEKYAWFGTHHWEGPVYTIEAARSSLEEIQKRQERIVDEPSDTAQLDDPTWRWFETSLYWRTHCAELTASVVFASRSRLTNIAERFGLSYDELLQCSAAEIVTALDTKSDLPNADVRMTRRDHGYGCIVDEHHIEHLFQGDELDEWIKTVEQPLEAMGETRSLKGMVACLGQTVQGTARVVLSPRDHSASFQDGDILVAFETTPDYVPLMKRAAAIVTEHGGITSHAAIVARELGVPCLIGVKNVTRLIRDGNQVTIDTQAQTLTLL